MIDDNLSDELLSGENEYFCSKCKSKQNAKKSQKLIILPENLNIVLKLKIVKKCHKFSSIFII